ncbi:MAG TPA: ScyD/ScyE family protein [Gaiellaceae bacterium]|nr:ScyD/ScyE family protein [Gaiellaceae bacterium]
MRGHTSIVGLVVLVTSALAVLVVASAASGRQAATITVIADGLNNPRGVTVNRNGAVFVAEAGKAGPQCLAKDTCLGMTGGVTRWRNGRKDRIVSGLPSIGGQDGSFAVGAGGVAVDPTGPLFVAMTDAPECKQPPGLPTSVSGTLGKVVRWTARLGVTRAADISGAECANNFDKADRNSNPYALASIGPSRQVVVDAGANALFEVNGGTVKLLAVFPKTARGSQSVPTSVAVGPDGNYYVGEFVGEPAKGKPRRWEARVWKVVPGQPPAVYLRGFNAITGLAFAKDGTLFVTEWSINPASEQEARGDVVKVAPDGKRARIGFGELHFPSGAAIGADGSLYVSNWSVLGDTPAASGPFAGKTGELVRIANP